ncbi:winged helix-turn-helix transcriptional regulator [Halovivax sp.]|uniref:winged helix-turn-helix transcriptional regulator n=1 Tax=Halovivax sp. TaxID=1935978 RepID=UPI0025C4E208|nr:winged helix-turn-helix transcriptional regulator [Halovivax sp.]
MRQLDETDLEILRLLLSDSRRPYREIAEKVGLSPPAVSDRIDRLQEQGIVRRFTVDIDRRKLRDRLPVMLTLEAEPAAVDRVYESVAALDGVEHVFKHFDGTVVAHANAPDRDVNGWLRDAIDVDGVTDRDVALVADYEWTVDVSAADFALECPVCGNEVSSSGETARIDGEIKVFCCPTCKGEYEKQYEQHSEKA